MSASLSGVFSVQEFTDLGTPLVGGRLYTYTASTTTLKVAYADAAGTIPHTYTSDGIGGQYIALNARGELPAGLFLAAGAYDLALKRADGSTVWTRLAVGGNDQADTLRADLASTASASKGAGQVGFNYSQAYLQGTIGARMRDMGVWVRDFGAKGDGVTDDTAAIQAAIDFAATNELGKVYIGSGKFLCSGVLTIKQFTNLIGNKPTIAVTQAIDIQGTTLLTTANAGNPTAQPFLTMHYFSGVHDLSIAYPNQVNNLTGNTGQILQYPAAIQIGQKGTSSAGNSDGVTISRVAILNPFKGILLGDGTNDIGTATIRDVIMFPLSVGIEITSNKTHSVLDRVDIVANWWQSNAPLLGYVQANVDAIRMTSQDAVNVTDCYINFVNRGLVIGAGQAWIECTGVMIDEVNQPIVLQSAYRFKFNGGTLTRWQTLAPLVSISGSSYQAIEFSGTTFIGATAGRSCGIFSTHSAGTLNVGGCNFVACDYPAVLSVGSGMTTVDGCSGSSLPVTWRSAIIANGQVNGIPALGQGGDISSTFANLSFGTWTSGTPTGWTVSNAAMVSQIANGIHIGGSTGNLGLSMSTSAMRPYGYMVLKFTLKVHNPSGGSYFYAMHSRNGTSDAAAYKAVVGGDSGFATSLPQDTTFTVQMPFIAGATSNELRWFFVMGAAGDYFEITNVALYAGVVPAGINGPEYGVGSMTDVAAVSYDGPLKTYRSTTTPTAASWNVGDRTVNYPPTVGQAKAWSCTSSGSPGTWTSEGTL